MDDIVLGSETFEQHITQLKEFFNDVRKGGIKLNLDKTQIAKRELEFVGHVISGEGVKPIEKRLRKIQEMDRPRTVKQLRSFIGFVSYYRKFVWNFAEWLYPLNDLLKKKEKWRWSNVHQTAFEDIKKYFMNCVMLQYHDISWP